MRCGAMICVVRDFSILQDACGIRGMTDLVLVSRYRAGAVRGPYNPIQETTQEEYIASSLRYEKRLRAPGTTEGSPLGGNLGSGTWATPIPTARDGPT